MFLQSRKQILVFIVPWWIEDDSAWAEEWIIISIFHNIVLWEKGFILMKLDYIF